MDMKQTILTRRSCRSFTGEQITESECTALLEAANAAPVANGNYSDVKISVIQDQELLAKIEAAVCAAMPAARSGDCPKKIFISYMSYPSICRSGRDADAS